MMAGPLVCTEQGTAKGSEVSDSEVQTPLQASASARGSPIPLVFTTILRRTKPIGRARAQPVSYAPGRAPLRRAVARSAPGSFHELHRSKTNFTCERRYEPVVASLLDNLSSIKVIYKRLFDDTFF